MATTPEPRSWKEELTATGDELLGRVRGLVREGNVRRVIVKQDDQVLLEFPLTLGVVGALLAPQVAALGALAGLVTHCSVTVEREGPPGDAGDVTDGAPPRLTGPEERPGSTPVD
jgi:hypothetical protein